MSSRGVAHHKKRRTSPMWEPTAKDNLLNDAARRREMRQPGPRRLRGMWFTDATTTDGGVVRISPPNRIDRSGCGGSMQDMSRW